MCPAASPSVSQLLPVKILQTSCRTVRQHVCRAYHAVMFKVVAATTTDETSVSHVSFCRPLQPRSAYNSCRLHNVLTCPKTWTKSSPTVTGWAKKRGIFPNIYKTTKELHDFFYTYQGPCTLGMSIMCVCSFCYIKWRHLMNLLPLDNAILKLKHNGLLTLILTYAASNDLNPVYYAVWGALQKTVYRHRSFESVQKMQCCCRSVATITCDS